MGLGVTKTYVLVAILSLGILYSLSFGVLMGMETDSHGQMTACPFTMASSICTMGFSEHISLWQSMLSATLSSNSGILAIIGFIVLAVAITLKSLETDPNGEFTAYKSYSHRYSNSTPNKLTELFSRGILNPKIYALATL